MAELAYICAYFDWLDAMKRLDDAERGRLFTALLEYGMSGEEPDISGNEGFTFDALKLSIDVNKRNYAEKCDKLKSNGKKNKEVLERKSVQMKQTDGKKKQMLPNDTNCCQMLPNDSNCREDKDKYKDKYKDNDKEEDKYKDNNEDKLPSEAEGGSPSLPCEGVYVDSSAVEKVVALYHGICRSFPQVLNISEKRWAAVNALLQTYTLDRFSELFRKVEKSSFLKGINERKWCASFDWLMDSTNFTKVLEGNYDDKSPGTSPDKGVKARFVPNPDRDTGEEFDLSMAIMEAEMEKFASQ